MARSRGALPAFVALLSLAIGLVLLAYMQYRWIRELAIADGRRMHAALDFAANQYADSFDHDFLTRTYLSFAEPNPQGSAEELSGRYEAWAKSARDPRIIRAIYFVAPGSTELQQLDLKSRRFAAVQWPAALVPVRDHLAMMQPWFIERIPPVLPSMPALIVRCGTAGMVIHTDDQGRVLLEHVEQRLPIPIRKMAMCPAFTILELDRGRLTGHLLPQLTQRYFGSPSGGEYQVAIVQHGTGDVLYRSSDWPAQRVVRADIAIPIFRLRLPHIAGGAVGPEPAGEWRLAVRYRGGSLADAVRSTHFRNVGIAAAILVVLAGSVASLVIMLRRAQRLQQQQLEFVAGITHELNTPLAALTAAGQNLADGIVPRDQTAQYGGIIVKESRRLTDMVAEVLDYAGMESGRRTLRSGDVDIATVIDDAIEQCRWSGEGKDIRIEKHIEGRPHATGDAAALTRAVQNLVANALRHGGDGGWVRVSAAEEKGCIAITVEDGGRGIPASELSHLFEPFFRGSAAQVRGSGLGLTIVDRVARAHGGSVSADAHRRSGAAFTLRLPLRAQTAGEMAAEHA